MENNKIEEMTVSAFTSAYDLSDTEHMPDTKDATPEEIAATIVSLLDEHKAQELKVLHVTDQTVLTDYFVLCTATSNTQVKSLAGEVEYKLGLAGIEHRRMDGYESGEWVVIDYASVLVHIFQRSTREFYNLEKLWSEGKDIDISKLLR